MYEKVKEQKRRKRLFRARKVNRTVSGNIMVALFLTVIGAFTAAPLFLAIINSFKPLNELWIFPPKFYVMNPTFQNYSDLLTVMNDSVVPLLRYVFNTLLITILGTVGQIVFGSMCAYPLAKHNFPGHQIYFKIIFFSLMFSTAVTAIPSYLVMAKLGWIDTYMAVLVPVLGSTMGVYLMKQFMEQIHDAMLEAARIDGASEYCIFWKIVMPNVKAAWLTLIVFAVQSLWSMGANPYIYSEELKTLNFALGQIMTAGIARAGIGSAVAVIMMIVPITVFIITQSNVIEGMASAGVKE